MTHTQNSQKDIFITSKAVDIIHSPYYILGDENIFAVLYMCHFAMGLTLCYKTAVFLHLYLQFFY